MTILVNKIKKKESGKQQQQRELSFRTKMVIPYLG